MASFGSDGGSYQRLADHVDDIEFGSPSARERLAGAASTSPRAPGSHDSGAPLFLHTHGSKSALYPGRGKDRKKKIGRWAAAGCGLRSGGAAGRRAAERRARRRRSRLRARARAAPAAAPQTLPYAPPRGRSKMTWLIIQMDGTTQTVVMDKRQLTQARPPRPLRPPRARRAPPRAPRPPRVRQGRRAADRAPAHAPPTPPGPLQVMGLEIPMRDLRLMDPALQT
jgi:hypothetical protein